MVIGTLWPSAEPVGKNERRDLALLESAINRPFQTAFGKPIHRTTVSKAAALFHSLVTNHPFANGNKRTAVVATDMFLLVNGIFLALHSTDVYRLAKMTAQHNQQGISSDKMLATIRGMLKGSCLRLRELPPELRGRFGITAMSEMVRLLR
jgi:death on curing protein